DNSGQAISVRGLHFTGAVPAVRTYGTFCLMEATLEGTGAADKAPAIINYNGGRFYARDLNTTGFSRAIADVATPDFVAAFRVQGADKPGSQGPAVAEYASHKPSRLFPGGEKLSLRLPIEETPEFPPEDPKSWAIVDTFGADPSGNTDSAAAIQKALDSGAATVFFPGHYALSRTVTIPPTVRRILGCGRWVDYKQQSKPDFRIEAGDRNNAPLRIEHFADIYGGIENRTDRTLVLRSIGTRIKSTGGGKLFFEDVASDEVTVQNQKVWARQLNIENKGTHLKSDRTDLWILGYKTERGGTLIATKNGRTEVFGGFSYTTNAGPLAPMFTIEQAALFTFFSEVCYNGDPFRTLVRETRGSETKQLDRGEAGTWPFVSGPPPR
ncbi:MAG: glycosyl hydrolase family 28-related protein, partial [Gemmataceae bacterium]